MNCREIQYTLGLEKLQFLFVIGGTDITDLISNTLGGIMGIGLYFVFSKVLKERTNKILNMLALIAIISIVLIGLLVI